MFWGMLKLKDMEKKYNQKMSEYHLLLQGIDREHERLGDLRSTIENMNHQYLKLEGRIAKLNIEYSRLTQMIEDAKEEWERR
jgi:chromosome segregation ATPase